MSRRSAPPAKSQSTVSSRLHWSGPIYEVCKMWMAKLMRALRKSLFVCVGKPVHMYVCICICTSICVCRYLCSKLYYESGACNNFSFHIFAISLLICLILKFILLINYLKRLRFQISVGRWIAFGLNLWSENMKTLYQKIYFNLNFPSVRVARVFWIQIYRVFWCVNRSKSIYRI